MLDILLIIAAGVIGSLVTGYILSRVHWRRYNELFRWHLKNVVEVKAAERKRYDEELEKIRKLQVERFGKDNSPMFESLQSITGDIIFAPPFTTPDGSTTYSAAFITKEEN